MPDKRASNNVFIKGVIQEVAEVGIENTRTKAVAEYAGFSEATMYRLFATKEILLREAFLYIDRQVSGILTQSDYIRNPGDTPFELAIYDIWHDVFRYLLNHKKETIFLLRYRYSSLYTEEVRSKRQANDGGFNRVYELFKKHFGSSDQFCGRFLISYIFELTLWFSEKIITGKLEDNQDTERGIWLTISSVMNSGTLLQSAIYK